MPLRRSGQCERGRCGRLGSTPVTDLSICGSEECGDAGIGKRVLDTGNGGLPQQRSGRGSILVAGTGGASFILNNGETSPATSGFTLSILQGANFAPVQAAQSYRKRSSGPHWKRWPSGFTGFIWWVMAALRAKPPRVAGQPLADLMLSHRHRGSVNGALFVLDERASKPDKAMNDQALGKRLWERLELLTEPSPQ